MEKVHITETLGHKVWEFAGGVTVTECPYEPKDNCLDVYFDDIYLGTIFTINGRAYDACTKLLDEGENPITCGWSDGAGHSISYDGWGEGLQPDTERGWIYAKMDTKELIKTALSAYAIGELDEDISFGLIYQAGMALEWRDHKRTTRNPDLDGYTLRAIERLEQKENEITDIRVLVNNFMNDKEFWKYGGIPTVEKQIKAFGMNEDQSARFLSDLVDIWKIGKEVEEEKKKRTAKRSFSREER
jgi:hypothetical protein